MRTMPVGKLLFNMALPLALSMLVQALYNVVDSVYVAGAKAADGQVLTAGGRVLGVVAVADTPKAAVAEAYARVNRVHFENAYYRNDIGARALAAWEKACKE